MLKIVATVAMFLIPGSSIVGLLYLGRKLYVRYVHTDMEDEQSILNEGA